MERQQGVINPPDIVKQVVDALSVILARCAPNAKFQFRVAIRTVYHYLMENPQVSCLIGFAFLISNLVDYIQLQIPFEMLLPASAPRQGVEISTDLATLNTVNLGCLLTTLKRSIFKSHEIPPIFRCYNLIRAQTFHETLELLVRENPFASSKFRLRIDGEPDVEISGDLQLATAKTCLTEFLNEVLPAAMVILTNLFVVMCFSPFSSHF